MKKFMKILKARRVEEQENIDRELHLYLSLIIIILYYISTFPRRVVI